jgi:hypothetical protein
MLVIVMPWDQNTRLPGSKSLVLFSAWKKVKTTFSAPKSPGYSIPFTAHTQGPTSRATKQSSHQFHDPAGLIRQDTETHLLHPRQSSEEELEDSFSFSWQHTPACVSSIRAWGGASVTLGPQGARSARGQSPKMSHFTRMEFHDLCILIKFLFLWNLSKIPSTPAACSLLLKTLTRWREKMSEWPKWGHILEKIWPYCTLETCSPSSDAGSAPVTSQIRF